MMTPKQVIIRVIYLYPEKNSGTFYNDKNGSEKKTIEWKTNRAVFFQEEKRGTHEGDGLNDNLPYNLMTKRIREVYS